MSAGLVFVLCILMVSTLSHLVDIDEADVEYWYGSRRACMLSTAMQNETYHDAIDKCNMEPLKTKNNPFLALLTSSSLDGNHPWQLHAHCCTEEMPLRSRGFLQAVPGFENPHQTPVLDMFLFLSKSNKSLVCIGDSLNMQMVAAMNAELEREIALSKHASDLVGSSDSAVSVVSTETRNQLIALHPNYTAEADTLFNAYRWRNVMIYALGSNAFGMSNQNEAGTHVTLFLPHILAMHPSGAYIVGNVGHHLGPLVKTHDPRLLVERMQQYVIWMSSLQSGDAHHTAMIRESPPAHFDSMDGSFEAWETPHGYDPNVPHAWDDPYPLYHCKRLDARAPNRIENRILRRLIQAHFTDLSLIHVFDYWKEYYKMHYGNCEAEVGRHHLMDCIHVCSFAPPMWMPMWQQLHLYTAGLSSLSRPPPSQPSTPYTLLVKLTVGEAVVEHNFYIQNGVANLIPSGESLTFLHETHPHLRNITIEVDSSDPVYATRNALTIVGDTASLIDVAVDNSIAPFGVRGVDWIDIKRLVPGAFFKVKNSQGIFKVVSKGVACLEQLWSNVQGHSIIEVSVNQMELIGSSNYC